MADLPAPPTLPSFPKAWCQTAGTSEKKSEKRSDTDLENPEKGPGSEPRR